MSLHRYNPRRDANEKEIIEALRSHGCSVRQLSVKGLPDLIVGYRGQNFVMEVKTEKGKLTPDQEQTINNWMGEIHIVRTPEEALKVIGLTQ